MSIRIEYGIDYLAYKVVRIRGAAPHNEVLTKDGWVKMKEGSRFELDETMLWDADDLQELVTQLQKLGIKPKDASYTEGLLTATQKHLEDMRLLALPSAPTEEGIQDD